MIHGVKLIGAMIRDAPSELRIKALDTVCSITKLQVNTLKFTDVLCVSCNIWYKIYDKKNTLLLIFYLIWNCNTVFDNRKKSDICMGANFVNLLIFILNTVVSHDTVQMSSFSCPYKMFWNK